MDSVEGKLKKSSRRGITKEKANTETALDDKRNIREDGNEEGKNPRPRKI